MAKMHADEAETDADLVQRLLSAQFPQWAGLPIRRLPSGGTVNAIYRVGTELTVRLPLTATGTEVLDREARCLEQLAPLVPVVIPAVAGIGVASEDFPSAWAVHRWIDGEVLVEGRVAAPERLARDLAAFVTALHKVDLDGGAPAHRGAPLVTADTETRTAIEDLRLTDEPFDADAALAAWEAALAVPAWPAALRWIHSDLMPSNLLVVDDRLAAVLDFSTVGTGDPAADLIPAWNLLPPSARQVFRDCVDVDDDTWARGRGWALSMAVTQLPYYRHTNPVISANARYVIGQILAG
ncbi:aminoglycoside phosphotransferase family protein [Streptomyces sp. NPDC093589]|uniref:aminoglycoside phosphotransferase family protein n=1 Tax=Streptomyces sp. NPDC093589 TaxID=3366043 RepID=UPI0038137428